MSINAKIIHASPFFFPPNNEGFFFPPLPNQTNNSCVTVCRHRFQPIPAPLRPLKKKKSNAEPPSSTKLNPGKPKEMEEISGGRGLEAGVGGLTEKIRRFNFDKNTK